MRSYVHSPDERFLQGQLPKLARSIELSEQAIPKKVAEGKIDIYDAAVDTAFTLTQVQWGLGEPLDEVVATMRRTNGRLGAALGHGFVVGPHFVDRWIEIAIIGGDAPAAAAVADAVDRGIEGLDQRGGPARWFLAGLVALLRGETSAANEAADALGRSLDDPSTAPAVATAFTGLAALVGAAASGDQAAFERAAVARGRATAATYGASVELRRSADGLLDAAGAAVARMGTMRGLRLPDDDPYLAAELMGALPWPAKGA